MCTIIGGKIIMVCHERVPGEEEERRRGDRSEQDPQPLASIQSDIVCFSIFLRIYIAARLICTRYTVMEDMLYSLTWHGEAKGENFPE